ncbi:hypothetical protein [Candidatus Amarolinea dominans]|uniref:hypothetical protein n=1 Tax=Candidatus Amarolinea dominans TaxID=3140696 RepID=UPI003135C5AB|nr:hypothetical protein [Anaerolineae bacterium]
MPTKLMFDRSWLELKAIIMQRRRLIISVLATFVSLALLCAALSATAFFSLSLPSSERLARQYVAYVARGDFESIRRLAGSDSYCQEMILQQARKDFTQLSGAEIVKLTIEVVPTSGSSDTIEFARASIEFRRLGEQALRNGDIVLVTNHALFGLRYVCSELGQLGSEYW